MSAFVAPDQIRTKRRSKRKSKRRSNLKSGTENAADTLQLALFGATPESEVLPSELEYSCSASTPVTAPAPALPKPYSVSEITKAIRGIVEPSFNDVWVRGEISNCKLAPSGHAYLSLKDSGATISAAVFGWSKRSKKTFELKDGLEVVCRGKISIYPPRGSYQLVIDRVELLGAGALQLAFEQLKERLSQEGLFSQNRVLPKYPHRIAVITSPTGAAIQDMINVFARRAPQVQITIVPTLVQGDSAHEGIIHALKTANDCHLGDIIVLARGGGSIEDLWCFNHEELAREIYRSKIPVISGVGHEIDFTIADFVSDLRAPTPSAAAEIVTANWVEAIKILKVSTERLWASITRELTHRKSILKHLSARVVSPKDRLREQSQRTDDWTLRMERAIQGKIDHSKNHLGQLMVQLHALSPLNVLERGYAIVRTQPDKPKTETEVIKSSKSISKGQKLLITFKDGDQPVQVI
jgi:exodeoxyribonuclease VII large subunit